MEETLKYFETLQIAANILTHDDINDFENVERGMGAAWDMLCDLNFKRLIAEQVDESKIGVCIKLNREKCQADGKVSFLDIDRSVLVSAINKIAEIHPVYRKFHDLMESDPFFTIRFGEDDTVESLTEIYDLLQLFEEKRRELVSVCNIKLTNNAEVAEFNLPAELDTERARKYFKRAIDAGLIKRTQQGFEWIKNGNVGEGVNVQVALFCGAVYCGDRVKDSRYGDKWQLGDGIFPDAPLKRLFGLKTLATIRTNGLDGDRCKSAPRGWERIMAIFDE